MKQLRITTTLPGIGQMLEIPAIQEKDIVVHGGPIGELEFTDKHKNSAKLHESMESLVPCRKPLFIDGDIEQCERPADEQDILLILPEGKTYKLKAQVDPEDDDCYELLLQNLEDAN